MRESFSPQEIRYLKLLRKQYRTIQEASAEVAHLRAVLRLPKGTEPVSYTHLTLPTTMLV